MTDRLSFEIIYETDRERHTDQNTGRGITASNFPRSADFLISIVASARVFAFSSNETK